MYEFHGWMGLAESPSDVDEGAMTQKLRDFQGRVNLVGWSTASAHLEMHNGQAFFYLHGLVNRVRQETDEAYELLEAVAKTFPGAWGLFYERADEFAESNAYRVRRLARGTWSELQDPFLSPCIPVIED